MTKVDINPGVCGLRTRVTAHSDDEQQVTLTVDSGCPAVRAMFEALGSEFDAYELCLAKPGDGPLYEYARAHFPGHCACPTLAGIAKCVEVECKLALPRSASIEFVQE